MTTIMRLIGFNSRPTRVVIMLAAAFTFSSGAVLAQTNVTTTGGTINKIPKWSPTTSQIQDSVIAESSNNIGIGTTNPLYKLDIFGSVASQVHLTSDNSSKGLYLFANGDDAYYLGGMSFDGSQWVAKSTTAAGLAQAGGAFVFYSNTGLTAGNAFTPTERARLDVTGNLRIGSGNFSPVRLLHLRDENPSVFAGARVSVSQDSSDPVYELLHETANKGFRWRLGNGAASDLYLDSTTNGFSSYTPQVTVLNNGNFGIGTSSPGAKLEVAGNSILKTSGPVSFFYDTTGTANARHFYFWNTNGHLIGRWVNDANTAVVAESITFLNNGNVGIGTTDPWVKLNVYGGRAMVSALAEPYALGLHRTDASGAFWLGVSNSTNADLIFSNSGGAERARITDAGRLGVGTASPSTTLHVVGTATITGAISTGALAVTGNITATGSVTSTYQDLAEWVPASQAIPSGTVVTLDPARSNHVLPSSRAYDTRVAGVVSARPGVLLGEAGEGKVMVATTGRVRVRVDASKGPIRVGDLLVTSDKEGFAMRSQPLDLGGTPIHRPGTLIGKALEPLEKGVGEILVLLSLQ